MNSKKITIAGLVAAAAIAALFVIIPRDGVLAPAQDETESAVMEDPSDGGSGDQAGLPTYSLAQVAEHSSKDDCWTVINNSIYNLTSFIPSHPGGDEILRACGKDGTSLFVNRETEDGDEVGSGTPHSSNAVDQLAKLKIGELAE